MSITIGDTEMTRDQSPRAARIAGGGWEATWLPGRALASDQAITVMALAEAAAFGLARITEGGGTAGESR